MNERQYNQILLRQMRKIPDTFRGHVNTSAIDRAYARDQINRDLNYERLATQRDLSNSQLDLGRRRLDIDAKNFARNYGFAKDQIGDATTQMNIANLISAGGVGVNYLQGANQRRANRKLTDLLNEQAAFYKALGE